MSNVTPFRTNSVAVRGIGRDADDQRTVMVYFTRPLTDDELRFFHEVCARSAPLFPTDEDRP